MAYIHGMAWQLDDACSPRSGVTGRTGRWSQTQTLTPDLVQDLVQVLGLVQQHPSLLMLHLLLLLVVEAEGACQMEDLAVTVLLLHQGLLQLPLLQPLLAQPQMQTLLQAQVLRPLLSVGGPG